MSNSIAIPTRKQATAYSSSPPAWISSSSSASSLSSPLSSTSSYASSPSSSSKGKQASVSSSPPERIAPRRPSLLGTSFTRSEHTVINLNSDGPPRLVTCVKSSQGFDWNQELFLPSHADYDAQDLEHKQDPVEEIILTEEEAAGMLPQ